jgi:hypothetical protein
MKLENQRLMCNNMNVADGVETMDVTPSWRTAIKMWFTGIRNTTNLMQTADDCEKEMIRLATAYEGAVGRIQADAERIDQLGSDLQDAREAHADLLNGIDELSQFETSGGHDAVYWSDIIDLCRMYQPAQLEIDIMQHRTAKQSDF